MSAVTGILPRILSFVLSTVSALYAQAPPDPGPAGVGAPMVAAVGLQQETDGRVLGTGPRYDAVFTDRGVVYTPVLGTRVERDLPLAFELLAVGRGTADQAVAPARRTVAGHCVRFERGDVVEVYELRLDGVKQDFVFARLPGGSGDLVVRGRITTELTATAGATADGMKFECAGAGGVTLGNVVGIDASGARCAGSLRRHGDEVEFVLPAAFVDGAALPITVDPLIGTAVNMNDLPLLDDRFPDLAFDDTNNVWLMVWARSASGGNQNIFAQRLDVNGGLLGGALAIESSAVSAGRPRVANLQASNRFVVVWEEAGDVKARAVNAADGALSGILTVATGTDTQANPIVAGDQSTVEDEALVLWDNVTDDTIEGIQVEATANGGFTLVGGTVIVVSDAAGAVSFIDDPAISRSGGVDGRYAVVYHRFISFPSASDEVRGVIVDRDLVQVRPGVRIATGALDPEVDGDGDQWVVAYELPESGGVNHDAWAVSWQLNASGSSLGNAVVVENDANDDESNPTVAWLGNSALIAYSDSATVGFDIDLKSIDPFTCVSCEGSQIVDSLGNDSHVRVAGRFASGENNDGAALAWSPAIDTTTFFHDAVWQQWNSTDGATSQLGGGCGAGGTAHATCAHPGNAGFTVRLRAAAANAAAFVVFGFRSLNASCGACTLVPDPFTGLVEAAGTTDASGDTQFVLALPNEPTLVGRGLTTQFLVTGTACLSGLDLSSAIRFTIE